MTQATTLSNQPADAYLEDLPTFETKLVVSSSFKVVFGDGLHGLGDALQNNSAEAVSSRIKATLDLGCRGHALFSESLLPSMTRSFRACDLT